MLDLGFNEVPNVQDEGILLVEKGEQAIMKDRYRKEVYTEFLFDDATECGIAECEEKPDPNWHIWITVSGKEKKVKFCNKHGLIENNNERLYRLGF